MFFWFCKYRWNDREASFRWRWHSLDNVYWKRGDNKNISGQLVSQLGVVGKERGRVHFIFHFLGASTRDVQDKQIRGAERMKCPPDTATTSIFPWVGEPQNCLPCNDSSSGVRWATQVAGVFGVGVRLRV